MGNKNLQWPVGILDIGSNTVRMVVFDGPKQAKPSFNTKVSCKLGRGIETTGKLSADSMDSARHAIRGFHELSQAMGVGTFYAFATAAVRDASNGPKFVSKLEGDIHEKIKVISGEQEGRLAAQGVASKVPHLSGVVCDLGGGSLELAVVNDGRFRQAMTLPLGSLRLLANKHRLGDFLEEHLGSVPESYAGHNTLYLVGGSFRAMGRAHGIVHGKTLTNGSLNGYGFGKGDVSQMRHKFEGAGVDRLVNVYGVGPDRADAMPQVGVLAEQLVERLDAHRVVVSTAGVRDGVLHDLKKYGKIRNGELKR